MDTIMLSKHTLYYKTKLATTCTEGGHKQTSKSSTIIETKVATTLTGDRNKQISKFRTTI